MMWLLFGTLAVMIYSLGISGQDIQFPTEDEDDRLSGNNPKISERIPLYVPDRCPINMLLYPGDGNTSAWECDCKRGYLYFPLNDSCFPAYRQGPCEPQNYAVLSLGEAIPKCQTNPCLKDGLVFFKNMCYELRKVGGPCAHGQYIDVNETTFQLECVSASIDPFMIIDVPANRCPNGSRRNTLGQCRKMI
ncbi:uncharacterized protein LOC105685556 [Athalia rosae]|uniref:uncharacterized protein LOC105685556 n=1 Tax=Athalia rosae TaxID=37344 RepID=UPI00062604BA|nr:uncharacterized protein LOC105685556 [Athalia rosae]